MKSKLKPEILFINVSIFFLLLGILTKDNVINIQFHDTYIIISSFWIAVHFTLLTIYISFIYFLFSQMKRPINLKIGYWHFGLVTSGFLLFFIFIFINYQLHNGLFMTAIFYISIILFFSSFIVFIYGLIKAIFYK